MSVRSLRRGAIAASGAVAAAYSGPAFRAVTGGATSGAQTSVTLTIPAAVAVDDVMLAGMTTYGTLNITTPAGWTLIRTDTGTGTNPCRLAVFRKTAVSGDTGGSATVVFTTSGSTRSSAALVAYSGAHTTSPVDAQGSTVSSGNGTTITAPGVTTTTANTRVVEFFAMEDPGLGPVSLSSIAATQRGSVYTATDLSAIAVSDQEQVAAETTTAKTATANTGSAWVGTTVALAKA